MGSRAAGRRPRLAVAAVGLAAVIGAAGLLAGCASPSAPPQPSAPAGSQPPFPSQSPSDQPTGSEGGQQQPQATAAFTKGLLLGVFAGGQGLAGFDDQVGQAILTVTYVHWGTPVSRLASLITSAASDHAEAVLELEPGTYGHNTSQIAAGTGGSDDWLDQFGELVAQLGDPVVVSFFPEMNGPWHSSWSDGPAGYVQAYRHVHDVLVSSAGALITWFWQASAIHKDTPSPMPWWPGSRYVDVAALDSYYYYPHDTFNAVFGKTIAQIRLAAPMVPLMIGETATGPLFDRQVWEINNLFAGIRRDGLIGLVWFDQFQHNRPYQFHQDWRLQDNPAALAAFRACLTEYGPLAKLRAAN